MSFKPVLRFAALSDIHIHDEPSQERERFAAALRFLSSYADASDYKRIDAVCVTGDFATSGTDIQMQEAQRILNEGLRPETELIISVASHEFHSGGYEAAYERLKKYFNIEPDVHKVINGFHFISLSTEQLVSGQGFGKDKQKWAREQLDAAAFEDDERPIFFFQHPHPTNTCCGSIRWDNNDLYDSLSVYPQVISFSGHSHAPVNDPRSIDQKEFTSCGTGSLSYFELDEFDKIYGTVPPKAHDCAQFLLVEADAEKRVRILAYDILSGKFFPQQWDIPTAWDRSTFVYNDMRPGSHCAPHFPQGAELKITDADDKGFTVSIPQAEIEAFYVDSYYIRLYDKKTGCKVKTVSVWSEYYFANMPPVISQRIDAEPGEYRVEVWAQGFWGKKSDNRLSAEAVIKSL